MAKSLGYLQQVVAAALVGLALLLPSEATAAAAGVTVAPVRVDLSPNHTSSFIQLINGDAQAKLMHVRTFLWDQSSGKDRLTPTQDLIVSPPIFALQPGTSQIVRMGLLEPPSGSVERAYRILVTEVPQTSEPNQIRVILQLSIPVFVAAHEGSPFMPDGAAQSAIQFQAMQAPHHRLDLTVSNAGAEHVRFTRLIVRDAHSSLIIADNSNPQYVLAGQQVHRILTLPASPKTTQISVEAYSETRVFRSTIALARP